MLKKAFGAFTKWIHWVPCLSLLKPKSQMAYSRIPKPLYTFIKGSFLSHSYQFIRNSQFFKSKRVILER